MTQVWQNLHAMFALTALDSLARDRQVAARINDEIGALLQGADLSIASKDEVNSIYEKIDSIKSTRNADRTLLFYQIAMLKAVYRRVVFMNYVAGHPLLASPEILRALEEEGESLEGQFIGACATLRFNGIRLAVDHEAGYGDRLDAPDRAALDALWEDFVVRVPGMDQLAGDEDPESRRRCGGCGGDASTKRLMVTSGRVAICDRCTLAADAAFAAMPAGQPRREQVGYGIFVPPPEEPIERALPHQPHCHFCQVAPVPDQPLVSIGEGRVICVICTEAVAKIVRRESRGSDPAYALEARKCYENMSALGLTELAELMRTEYERATNPTFPGPEFGVSSLNRRWSLTGC